MEHSAEASISIWLGLLITSMILTLYKVVKYRFSKNRKPFNKVFATANNWMDYVIHLGITAIFFYYEHDVLEIINPLMDKVFSWKIPHPHDKSFIFVLIPVLVSALLYKFLRKWFTEPMQEKIAPHIHNEHCNHEKDITLQGTVNPDPPTPPPPPGNQ